GRDFTRGQQHLAQQSGVFRGGFGDTRDRPARDDEDMDGRLWANVFDGEKVVRLMNEPRRDFARCDFFKKSHESVKAISAPSANWPVSWRANSMMSSCNSAQSRAQTLRDFRIFTQRSSPQSSKSHPSSHTSRRMCRSSSSKNASS